MNTCPHLPSIIEIVRYTKDLARTRPKLGEGWPLSVSGPEEICDAKLECLTAFKSIWGLHVVQASHFEPGALQRWPNLRYLAIDGADRPLDLSPFQHLEWLITHWRKGDLWPPEQTPMRRFAVWSPPGDDFSFVPAWSTLRILEVIRSRAISLTGVERLRELEHLGLIQASRLKSVAALAECSELKSIFFENCKRIEDIADLRGCTQLRQLVLAKCDWIDSVRFLDDMPEFDSVRLVRTYVRDGDMRPLLRAKQAIFDHKPHYSHHETQIAAMRSEQIGGV